jgi:hypothetical protein
VHWKLITLVLRGLTWTDLHDRSPYDDRCALLHFDTLFKRRNVALIVFVFSTLSSLLSMMHVFAPCYQAIKVVILFVFVSMRLNGVVRGYLLSWTPK